MNPTKTLLAGAAVAGLMAGSLAPRAHAAGTNPSAGTSLQTFADGSDSSSCKGKTGCKGKNDCKSQTNCKSKGSCKGQGGCGAKK